MKPPNSILSPLLMPSLFLNLLLMNLSLASSAYLPPEEWFAGLNAEIERGDDFQSEGTPPENFPIGANSGTFHPELRGLSPTDGPKPKKLFRDPLLSSLQQMRRLSLATPENLRQLENQKKKKAQRIERDRNSEWSKILKNGEWHSNLTLAPVMTNFSSASNIPHSGSGQSARLTFEGGINNIIPSSSYSTLERFSFGGGPEFTEGVNGLSAVRGHVFVNGGIHLFSTPESLDSNDSRLGVAGGIYADFEMRSTSLGLTSGTGIVGIHFGIDLHRLLIPKNSGVTMLQFQPTIAFFGSSSAIKEKLPGEKDTDTLYEVSTRSEKFLPSYGMIGKLIVRPGIMIDVLWLQTNAVSPDDVKNWNYGTNGRKILKSSVMVRIGKRFALKGSYQWTSVKSMYRDRDGVLSNSDITVEQASLGLNFLFANE
jgi:hypothetical protein